MIVIGSGCGRRVTEVNGKLVFTLTQDVILDSKWLADGRILDDFVLRSKYVWKIKQK